jgi:hypothetical protein
VSFRSAELFSKKHLCKKSSLRTRNNANEVGASDTDSRYSMLSPYFPTTGAFVFVATAPSIRYLLCM